MKCGLCKGEPDVVIAATAPVSPALIKTICCGPSPYTLLKSLDYCSPPKKHVEVSPSFRRTHLLDSPSWFIPVLTLDLTFVFFPIQGTTKDAAGDERIDVAAWFLEIGLVALPRIFLDWSLHMIAIRVNYLHQP